MKIGELAAMAEVNIQTIRFYEREGLMREPTRTLSGYRAFTETDLGRVRFIRLCQSIGFTLREIRMLLLLHENASEQNGLVVMKPDAVEEIAALATERLAVIDQKIKELSTMRSQLTSLIHALSVKAPVVCPVSR